MKTFFITYYDNDYWLVEKIDCDEAAEWTDLELPCDAEDIGSVIELQFGNVRRVWDGEDLNEREI